MRCYYCGESAYYDDGYSYIEKIDKRVLTHDGCSRKARAMSEDSERRALLTEFLQFLRDETDLTVGKVTINAAGVVILPREATPTEMKEAIDYFIESS